MVGRSVINSFAGRPRFFFEVLFENVLYDDADVPTEKSLSDE